MRSPRGRHFPLNTKDDEFEEQQEKAQNFFTGNVENTIYGALKPAFESEPRLLAAVNCVEVPGRENLYLLPGHLQLGEYEVSLGVAHELSGSLVALKNIPGAINHLLRITAEHYDADYVIVDMSPSLGALNQNIVSISDRLIVPASPDFFSIMALRSLARILPGWNRWAISASQNPLLSEATYAFPEPTLKFAGTVIQRYRLYRSPTPENPYGDPTGPFKQWIDRVINSIQVDLKPALDKAGLLLPAEIYSEAGLPNFVLAQIQEFNSLLPKSQEHGIPVFELSAEELGQAGVVLDNSMSRIESLTRIFETFADRLISLTEN